MADITSAVANLVASISSAAGRTRVNKRSCFYLALRCNYVLERLENGELGSPTDPKLKGLVATLEACRNDLTKFTGLGFLMRLIKSGEIPLICDMHAENLDWWLATVPERMSDAELLDEDLGAIRLEEGVSRNQDEGRAILRSDMPSRISKVLIVDPGKLEIGGEVGKFPFGTIYMGTYDDKPVYVREVGKEFAGAHLDLIMTSIRLSRCLADCQNILHVHGISEGFRIVTNATTHGPLSEFFIKDAPQKVAIARKVADAIMAMHDITAGRECVIHRDIRAANVLINKSQDGDLEPKITGFEMCKQSTSRTGQYPEIEESYRRWWSPERTSKYGTSTKSDVYSFGVLMYEISTGKEPGDGDLVKMEGMRICAEYTALMERCLDDHYDARPKMDQVVQELLSIENILMVGVREP
ncbi:kinase-like domain-containing protein [Gamsiella multidivaricata]|uniref:kinase-like domain-containing protein n=1 Tax=Gamsiella multidivaricata TaxID=101098 RepID=UPI0022209003|nr:kinase-like domain-containing protein [Gamsiella multidivaricata]KAG0369410.1 hypothetical protein BGZ54_009996 [Gamsiella multidivaricata]KAI7831423.1 kinase-like domain-containing protein [Gamsiella multidivaricata]